MLKKMIIAILGKDNYIKYVAFNNHLYHSFLPFKHRSNKITKAYLIPHGGVVLDIGAYIGRFTGMAASLVGKSGEVHSFEPVTSAFRVLKKMVSLKRLRHVVLNQIALSDKNESAEISIPLKGGWKPQVQTAHLGGNLKNSMKQVVTTQRLDDYCNEKNIRQIDFIKCDTEGYEYFIFSGGLKCLAKFKPSIICEIYKKYSNRQNIEPSATFKLLLDLGYKAYLTTEHGTMYFTEGYQKPANYIFVHPSKMTDSLSKIIIPADEISSEK